MKTLPFDYEKYKNEGYEVVTRDGLKVEQIFHFDKLTTSQFPLKGVFYGSLESWKIDGRFISDGESSKDLFLVAKPVERWMNVYKGAFMAKLYESRADADREGINRLGLLHLTFSDDTLTELLTSTPIKP